MAVLAARDETISVAVLRLDEIIWVAVLTARDETIWVAFLRLG